MKAYKNKLFDQRTRLIREVTDIENSIPQKAQVPEELSDVPFHPANLAAEWLYPNVDLAQNEAVLLELVEEALERIEDGTFGTCQRCGGEIEPKRLDAIPYTPYCIACARVVEREITAPQ
jgi:DnaK suppressor protein